MRSLILVVFSLCVSATRSTRLPISSEYTETRRSSIGATAPDYSSRVYGSTETNPGNVYVGTPPAVPSADGSKNDVHFYMLPRDVEHGSRSELYRGLPVALYCYRATPSSKAEQNDGTPLSVTPLNHGSEPSLQMSSDLRTSDAPAASEAPLPTFRSIGHPHKEGGIEMLEHLMRNLDSIKNNEKDFNRLFYNPDHEADSVPILLVLQPDSESRGHQSTADVQAPPKVAYANEHVDEDHVEPYRNLDKIFKVLAQEKRVSAPLPVSETVPTSEPTPAFTTTSDQSNEKISHKIIYGHTVLEQPEAEENDSTAAPSDAVEVTEQEVKYGKKVLEPPQEEGNKLSRFMSCQCQCLPVE